MSERRKQEEKPKRRRERVGRTLDNFQRRAETRLHRLERAAERREKKVRSRRHPDAKKAAQAVTAMIEHKRAVRRRKKEWKAMSVKKRGPSPTENGMRQFGPRAAKHHTHQRDNGLARALNQTEIKKLSEKTANVNVIPTQGGSNA